MVRSKWLNGRMAELLYCEALSDGVCLSPAMTGD